jgi:hypothetical protein
MKHEKEYLVTINVPPSLEEALVDALLTLEEELGFSSFMVNAHHHENRGLSLAEQVTGRQKQLRFQMYIDINDLDTLVNKLKQEFSGSGLQYWVLPVLSSGII